MVRFIHIALLLVLTGVLTTSPHAAVAAAKKPLLQVMKELEQMDTAEVQRLSERGDAYAKLEMATRYVSGKDVEVDAQKAIEIVKSLADKNDQAMYLMGAAYANGIGVTKDDAEALRWFERSAKKGNPNGQYGIATHLIAGRPGDPAAWVEALPWVRKAAVQGHGNAAFTLGVAYDKGLGVKTDPEMAATWYRRADAIHFHAQAQWNLGLLIKERGVKRQPGDPGASGDVKTNAE